MSSQVEPLIYTCPGCGALLDISEQDPFSEIDCPSCSRRMRVRNKFNEFELLEPIASGGMGTVYKARDTNLNRIIALKLIRKEFSVDEEYIAKLETEARVTASVTHPNVVKVYAFGSDQGLYYIAMELVDRGSLDDLMTLQGKISELQVLDIGIQAAEGLRAAYQAGLIHRDVKPGNILFSDTRAAKLVDFGLAMPLEQAQEVSEDIWGTPYYVAPEKLNHEPEDFRSDMYSLGGTLFHAVAGRPPFEADSASLVALKHLKSQAVSLQAFAPDVSSATSYVINRTLAKDPEDRYQSYDEFIEHLQYARAKLLESRGKPPQPKARVVLEGEEQQKTMAYIVMGVIGLLVAIGGVLFFFREAIATRNMSPEERERARLVKMAARADDMVVKARERMIQGEAGPAFVSLASLAGNTSLGQPVKNWTLCYKGIAAYLIGMPSEARESFKLLAREPVFSTRPDDQKLANFFPEIAGLMTRDGAVHESILRNFSKTDVEALAPFALGLKEWDGNRFEDAVTFFKAFLETAPEGAWAWVAGYKPLAQEYISQWESVAPILEEQKAAVSVDARRELQPKLQKAKEELAFPGRLYDYINGLQRSMALRVAQAPGTNLNSVRDRALSEARQFRFEEALKSVSEAKVTATDEGGRRLLEQRLAVLPAFKEALVADLAKHGYDGSSVQRRGGSTVSGKLTGADEKGITLSAQEKEMNIPWSDLSVATITKLALSQVTSGAGTTSGAADADRLWRLAIYNSLLEQPTAEQVAWAMRAAEGKPEYAAQLFLFDNLAR